MFYNRFRYYDPDEGQYISPDPIGLDGGLNTYGYVNNPAQWIDPLGLSGQTDCSKSYRTPFSPLGPNQRKELQQKLENRILTNTEWDHLQWDRRFSNRRNRGVKRFWAEEKKRLRSGESGTRNWSDEQRAAILSGKTPKFEGGAIEGHHTYNALDYPNMADDPTNIYPATKSEHLYRWHGGNFQNDTQGSPLNPFFDEEF